MSVLAFTNGATALTTAALLPGDGTVTIEAGKGDLFPSLGAGQVAVVALADGAGNVEIAHLVDRAGDNLTLERGQEGTAEQTWGSGTRVEMRVTAGVLLAMLQKGGGTMEGPLDMAGHPILNAVQESGAQEFDTLAANRFRGDPSVASNQLVIPSDGGSPTLGGTRIVTVQMLAAAIFQWSGDVASLPSYLRLCDGTQGTPDLRDRFIVGAGKSYVSGSKSATIDTARDTAAAGAHNHGGKTQGYKILLNDLPGIEFVSNVTASTVTDQTKLFPFGNDRGLVIQKQTGGGAAHWHLIDSADNHTHAVDVLPPYYALAFVMFKTGI